MRYYIALLIVIAAVTFLLLFSLNSFAESTYIEGDTGNLTVLTYTDYLSDKPVLIFSEQQNENKPELLDKVDNLVFFDCTWEDSVVKIATSLIIYGKRGKVEVQKEGPYELWLAYSKGENDEEEIEKSTQEWEIKCNGNTICRMLSSSFEEANRKFINIGTIKLKRGEYDIELESNSPKLQNHQIKLHLVNKREREDSQKIIWQKINNSYTNLGYIFKKQKKMEFFVYP